VSDKKPDWNEISEPAVMVIVLGVLGLWVWIVFAVLFRWFPG
jgi:cytoskeletal protein RodZ